MQDLYVTGLEHFKRQPPSLPLYQTSIVDSIFFNLRKEHQQTDKMKIDITSLLRKPIPPIRQSSECWIRTNNSRCNCLFDYFLVLYRERDSNPHEHSCSGEFKSPMASITSSRQIILWTSQGLNLGPSDYAQYKCINQINIYSVDYAFAISLIKTQAGDYSLCTFCLKLLNNFAQRWNLCHHKPFIEFTPFSYKVSNVRTHS